MFEIGKSLHDARMRRGLDIADCERETKIRGKYLRALEEEEFGMLPDPAYVKGFLRAYGDFLDVDPQLLLDEYASRFEPAPDTPRGPPVAPAAHRAPQLADGPAELGPPGPAAQPPAAARRSAPPRPGHRGRGRRGGDRLAGLGRVRVERRASRAWS